TSIGNFIVEDGVDNYTIILIDNANERFKLNETNKRPRRVKNHFSILFSLSVLDAKFQEQSFGNKIKLFLKHLHSFFAS
ncbi:unnamed protein product, partial [Rotaria sp. Silwood2]